MVTFGWETSVDVESVDISHRQWNKLGYVDTHIIELIFKLRAINGLFSCVNDNALTPNVPLFF